MDLDTKQVDETLNEKVQVRNKSLDKIDVVAPDRKSRNKVFSFRRHRESTEDAKTPTESLILVLSKGTYLHKVRGLDKFFNRKYHVDLENMRLHYSPSFKHYMCREVPYSEVRKGWESDRFNVIESRFRRKLHASIEPKNLPTLVEDNCFSLVFDDGTQTEDLVAPNYHERDLWVKGLSYLIATCKNQQREDEYKNWLKEQFRKADHNKNGNLGFDEILKLLNHLNIAMDKKHAKALFTMAIKQRHKLNIRTDDSLDMDGFLRFYKLINSRPEMDKIFREYSVNNTRIMGPEELMDFLKNEQKMSRTTLADCEAYIKRYEPEESQIPGYLSIKGFRNLFFSIDFDIFNRSHRIVCQEMFHPLSHYFIASSHNTYLMMGQLIGNSSIEAYRLALNEGCRCIELDVWDGEDGEPIIYHGYTMTTQIHLRDVLKTIHKYAFKTSQYPLILSMENHCSVDQQIVMAKLMTDILGEYLFNTPIDENEKHWPSPESLARKILIKGKKIPNFKTHRRVKRSLNPKPDIPYIESGEEEDEEEVDPEAESPENRDSDDELSESDSKDKEPVVLRRRHHSSPAKQTESIKSNEQSNGTLKRNSENKHYSALGISSSASNSKPVEEMSSKLKLAKEFSDLVHYCVAQKFVSFEDCFKKWKFNEMVSFDEGKSENFGKTKGNDYVKYNKNHLSRIYPKGSRIDSSNYNPIPHWNCGSQLVALNYQTCDKAMLFNDALFAMNGKCGYVLKAEYLRKGHQYGKGGRSSVLNSPTNLPKRVKITVISGQHIPKPGNIFEGEIIDPYVKVKVYGHPADKFEFQTKPVRNNGFNPIWEESCEFNVRLPEMAFIYFAVKDQSSSGKNALLGQYMLAFPAIMEGYRHVRLVDHTNQPLIPASLFVRISFLDIADYWSPE